MPRRLFAAARLPRRLRRRPRRPCGVTGPALYKHFASKDAVLAEMLVAISERAARRGAASGWRAPPDADDALAALVDWHVDFALRTSR